MHLLSINRQRCEAGPCTGKARNSNGIRGHRPILRLASGLLKGHGIRFWRGERHRDVRSFAILVLLQLSGTNHDIATESVADIVHHLRTEIFKIKCGFSCGTKLDLSIFFVCDLRCPHAAGPVLVKHRLKRAHVNTFFKVGSSRLPLLIASAFCFYEGSAPSVSSPLVFTHLTR